MQDFLPFIVIGLTAGSVYGLAGTGLVLTYKTSGVFNFAYGAIAAVAAYVFYWLHVQEGMAWQLAALLCLFVLGPLMGLLLELLTRMLVRGRHAVPDRRHDRAHARHRRRAHASGATAGATRASTCSSPTSCPPRRSPSST